MTVGLDVCSLALSSFSTRSLSPLHAAAAAEPLRPRRARKGFTPHRVRARGGRGRPPRAVRRDDAAPAGEC